ncbi:uncharacterized protein BX664DRAFT_319319 [Halteromyces radiatus]|uniref:uncharacterized protein n=1 Tax=Halteromyces radiatus TaxID=101107 RepID=UPI00221EE635|nr:uncharacterized protein BX664DRAFT_319319 [Halteromyces radiatus]KAI8098673.1 hypothetical protein BX664DRAFT_319319 [Halteromyces radiatus]
MSSVQAVIAALNQQSAINNCPQPTSRLSRSRPDISSIKNKFESTSTPKRSSNIEKSIIKERTSSLNRVSLPPSPLSSSASPYRSERSPLSNGRYSRTDVSTGVKNDSKIESLKKQLEQVTLERDTLKRQISDEKLTSTLTPPITPFWFDMDDHNEDKQYQEDYDDMMIDYHHQFFVKMQEQQQVKSLQSQLAACEIGTHWMINKYLGELEQERLYTKSLNAIVKNQEELINAVEISTSRPSSIMSTSYHQQQQTFLLQSQVEIQRMELEDKQEMLNIMADEREIMLKKINQLTQQLQSDSVITQQQQQMESGSRRQRNHPRTVSSSSSCSTSSYETTISSSTLSISDWVQLHDRQHQSTPLSISLTKSSPSSRPYSPPQTPPPKERLPPLPTSGSILSSTSSFSTIASVATTTSSPRSTFILAPSSPMPPSTPSSLALSSSASSINSQSSLSSLSSSSSGDIHGLLAHQKSLQDVRTLNDHHYQHYQHHHGYTSGDPSFYSDKRVIRQKSFWKGWKQRLSN